MDEKQTKAAYSALDKFLAETRNKPNNPTHIMGILPAFLSLGIVIDESIIKQDIPEGSTWWMLDTQTGELSRLEEYDPTQDG